MTNLECSALLYDVAMHLVFVALIFSLGFGAATMRREKKESP